ncbi:MAG: chemotaxis response regulator protein-glutamate methylesterase [Nevskia sp.]|nr:chemotaxis response regulator protein-glutamate methylesterase [Nevskia sp.]
MRIGIVNDLPMAVEALRRAVAANPGNQVVWVAHDGAEAVELCARRTPDLVLMDLIMPGMDGVEATRRIMAATPCAILIVTASVGANTSRVYEAMGWGALDAVDTPTLGRGDPRETAAPLLRKIVTIGKLIGVGGTQVEAGDASAAPAPDARQQWLVAIGASAGGPAAAAQVLAGLPADFPAAVAIVQHVDEKFAAGMAQWLGEQSRLPVRVACEGDAPVPGTVLLAGTADHLCLKSAERFGYVAEPRESLYRPSVDVFFHSVGRRWPGRAIGVLLTGMGRDGAAGLKALREKGHFTLAQDRATCAVYGMPKAAVEMAAAVEVLPLGRIAQRLVSKISGSIIDGGTS